MSDNSKLRTDENPNNSQSKPSWFFEGMVIRTIIRFSFIVQQDLVKEFGFSKAKFCTILNLGKVPPELTKLIAKKLDLSTPEEFQDYYDDIPEDFKENVSRDWRLRRKFKPGVCIPEWEIEEARRNGTLSALLRERGAL